MVSYFTKKTGEFSKKELTIRLIISSAIATVIVNMLLNTLWLVIMYDKAFIALLGTRAIKELIMIPVQIITILALVKVLDPIKEKTLGK